MQQFVQKIQITNYRIAESNSVINVFLCKILQFVGVKNRYLIQIELKASATNNILNKSNFRLCSILQDII